MKQNIPQNVKAGDSNQITREYFDSLLVEMRLIGADAVCVGRVHMEPLNSGKAAGVRKKIDVEVNVLFHFYHTLCCGNLVIIETDRVFLANGLVELIMEVMTGPVGFASTLIYSSLLAQSLILSKVSFDMTPPVNAGAYCIITGTGTALATSIIWLVIISLFGNPKLGGIILIALAPAFTVSSASFTASNAE